MKYRPYPKYKPSGVDGSTSLYASWLGDVPEHWEVKKLKYSCQVLTAKTDRRENPIALENIESWTGRFIETESEFDSEGIAFKKGNILFGKLRPYLAKVLKADKNGEAVGDLFVLQPVNKIDSNYIAFMLRSKSYIDIIDGSTFGSKMPRASWDFMGNLPSPIPPLPEQQAIASFLDRETGSIDELIGKKKKLVELLKEKRTALISDAVTGKIPLPQPLSPEGARGGKRAMKPSGVDGSTSLYASWLGDVPEHWEVKRLKFILKEPLKYGANEAAELDDPELPRFVRISDVDEYGNLRDETFRSLPEEIAKPFLLDEGDLLFARSGATVGKTFFYRKTWGRAAYAGYLIRARLMKRIVFPEFINFITKSTLYSQWISSILIQATIQNVSAEKYASYAVPLPPLPEQQAIAAFLDSETAKIDALSAKVEEAIGKLKEYRTALISAAVTGTIDVSTGLNTSVKEV